LNQKAIGLVDCNSFYCSCERLFRPELNNKPVVVLSNNDGCAVSRTDEAKALGIKMGEPYFKFKDICQKHQVHVFSTNFSLYTNLSDRVMGTLKKLSPEVEVYSVDEAFLDLTGIRDLSKHGEMMKEILLSHVGIPVGVGIGPTKVLAKAANRLAKKSKKSKGVVNLMEKKYQDVGLERIEIEDVWGIGRANSEKMRTLGIKTAKDLRDYKNENLIQSIFTKVGLQIKHELMGINCFPFNKPYEPKKEIMCSRTFGGTVTEFETLKESIANYVTDAAEKLRAQDSLCQGISVFARTNPFNQKEQYYLYESKKLETPTSHTLKLINVAIELLKLGFKQGYEYKKAGVRLIDFYSSIEYQLDLLKAHDSIEDIKLMNVVDLVNGKEGETVLKSAACGVSDKAWKMNRNFKSPRYTTSWEQLKVFQ
jgi:DNA polymerase V